MKNLISISLVFVIFAASIAHADVSRLVCVFEKPFNFGASISAGYQNPADAMFAFMANSQGSLYFGKNPGPVTELSKKFTADPVETNISEMINAMPSRAFGYVQLQTAVDDPDLMEKLTESSVIASVDAFYWPMVYDSCENSFEGLNWIMDLARKLNKPLILATVPIEDASKVDATVRRAWSPPKPNCTRQFNEHLLKVCKVENECFVADIAATVAQLNSTGITVTEDPKQMYGDLFPNLTKGQTYSTSQFRFDGVHISPAGNEWIQKLILEQLTKKLPSCASAK